MGKKDPGLVETRAYQTLAGGVQPTASEVVLPKVALTVFAAERVTVQVLFVPVHAPLHPSKRSPIAVPR